MRSLTTRCRARRSAAARVPAALVVGLLVALLATAGCKKASRAVEVPADELAIGDAPRLRTGPVGIGDAEKQATYVLVDVSNKGESDAVVAVGGALTDATEAELGPLRIETLRIPAGKTRMFALIDRKLESLPNAVAANIEIIKATRPPRDPPVIVTDVALHTDEGRAVIKGTVENLAENTTSTVVIGAFYDAEGAPMMRRTTVYRLDGKRSRSAQMVGPPGSVTGTLYIGDSGF